MAGLTIPWSPRLQAYNPSDDAERALRRGLAWDLLGQAGVLDAPDVQVVDPPGMSDEGLARVHAPAYIQAVRRYSAQPQMALAFEASQWGFVPGHDTGARVGMHEAAADVCGASVEGARAVWEGGPGSRAFCPAPSGLHHAFANKASGFCIYNDCALAIAWLLDNGAERVAYVDLDAHHGDGVQWIFHDDPRVLTVSVHEFAYGFYPGTGDVTERGPVGTPDTTVNVPLPPFAGDVAMLAAVDRVVEPAVRRFDPDVLVVHLGADVHHADPLTHLQMTLAGMRRCTGGWWRWRTRCATAGCSTPRVVGTTRPPWVASGCFRWRRCGDSPWPGTVPGQGLSPMNSPGLGAMPFAPRSGRSRRGRCGRIRRRSGMRQTGPRVTGWGWRTWPGRRRCSARVPAAIPAERTPCPLPP